MASHAIVKERDYTTDLHNPWNGWTIGADGRWYGEVAGEPWVPFQEIDQTQALYAYDPQQNTLDELVDYGDHPGREVIGARVLGGLLGATNGRIYGSFRNGLFEYDPVADTLLLKAALQFEADEQVSGHGATGSLVEVCRKPNYRPSATTQFEVCAGARFTYDLRNVNATSVVWRRNGIVDPAQADQQLTFDAIAGADEGAWTCTLANECGTTQPPPIIITVNPGSFTAGSITGDTLLCGNGDTALLTGNNGGTWSTGAISSTVGVNAPGAYYVRYQQACGLSFSNTVHVAHLDSAQAPPITDGSGQRFHEDLFMCPGQTAIFKNNVEGPWGLYTPGIWSNGTAAGTTAAITAVQDSGQYHVTVSNACNTDTSGSWHVRFFPPPPSPHLVFTDADGLPADASFCTGGSVFLNISVTNSNELWLSTGWTFPDGTFILGPHSIAATATGVYGLRVASCDVIDTAFTITLDSVLPDPPVILPDQDELIGCDQDTAYLTTLSPNSYWAWRDAQNVVHVDTLQQVQVDWHAGISGLYSLYAYNGCGTSQPDLIQVVGLPAPEVSYVETHDIVCLDAAPFPLTAGSPPGGSYSGPGVSGAVLDPAAAGLGTHTIVYAVDDGTCIGRASTTVSVQICTGIAEPEDAGVRIVPLPLHDRSFVRSVRDPILSYRLLDAVGRTVRDGLVGANELELDRDGLPAGSYLLQLRCAQRTIVRRIVVD
ncbi:MAG: T9SS type A sorting domain-containing protein [Flavobacteriales bacterium]